MGWVEPPQHTSGSAIHCDDQKTGIICPIFSLLWSSSNRVIHYAGSHIVYLALSHMLKASVRWQWSDRSRWPSTNLMIYCSPRRCWCTLTWQGGSPVMWYVTIWPGGCPLAQDAWSCWRAYNCVERPIAFTSRKISPAERKYSQLEKEGLACGFGMKKFHAYPVYLPILSTQQTISLCWVCEQLSIPAQASACIQHWALT